MDKMASLPPSHFYAQNPNPGQYRLPFNPQFPYQPGSHSMQSMTSHWNLPGGPGGPMHHPIGPGTGGGGGGGGVTPGGKASKQNHGPVLKPPKPPEKPLLPYMRYSRKMWEEFKKTEGSDLKVWEVGKIIGQKWRELGEAEKQPYFEEYEQEKQVYNDLIRQYHNSTAYKQYLEAKKMAERQSAAAHSNSGTSTGGSGSGGGHNTGLPIDISPTPPQQIIVPPRQTSSNDPRLLMLQQQQQEDDEDEYLSTKQLAAVRFHRNHRLMGEIFNEFVLPDIRVPLSSVRLEALKEQSKSLEEPLKKLEDEVAMLEAKYINKRAKFLDDAERFRRELKKIQENPPTTWKKPQLQLSVGDVPEPLESAKFVKL